MQTDRRWKDKPYQVKGETATVGDSGCGPSCAAMLIETITGRTFTPEEACAWSVAHGYKAKGQGTYYSYFAPQFAAFGIKCWQLSWTNVYHNPGSPIHDQALEYLKQGYYLIALMNKGTWTSSGHFILVWWADGKIRINDPASTKDARVNGDPYDFRSQAKYYWWVDARKYNNEEDDLMTGEQIISTLSDEQAFELLAKAQRHAAALPEQKWSQKEGHWARATTLGLVSGDSPEGLLKRCEMAAILGRKGLL